MNVDVDHQTHITMVKGVMNESFREEIEQFLVNYLGPKHLPYQSLIPITVIYSIIFISGLIGNFSTCIVIAKAHYMRTSTNYYLFNLAIADMLTLIFEYGLLPMTLKFFGTTTGTKVFTENLENLIGGYSNLNIKILQMNYYTRESLANRNQMLVNVISLVLYIWATVYLARVKSSTSFIWMHIPWMIFGMCAQLFGTISFFVDGMTWAVMSVGEAAGRPELVQVFREAEKALMWLQIDVGFSLIACSNWIMIHQSPTRMLVTIFVITALPLIAWASVHPKGAVGLTQLASIIHIMACLHANIIVLNFWGILSSLLMFSYLLFISLPQEYCVFRFFPHQVVLSICPAFMSWVFIRSLSGLSQLQINHFH